MLLEEDSPVGEAKPFRMARDVYKSCMDIGKIEQLGLEPVKQILNDLGGWPVLLGKTLLENVWKAQSIMSSTPE